MLSTFKAFLEDNTAWDMFVTGKAGRGKTTKLKDLVQYCIDNELDYVVSAYTHKALGVLENKLPEETNLMTLHAFLGKRPTINGHATKSNYIEQSTKVKSTATTAILFIDEFSMVCEKDSIDIVAEQDPEYTGKPGLKVVWIGDPLHQLQPVGGKRVIEPYGDYNVELTKSYRTAEDNPLYSTLEQLCDHIEGKPIAPLIAHEKFLRERDIVKSYKSCKVDNKIILAYTNKCVEELNAEIQGRTEPSWDDILYSPTTRKSYRFLGYTSGPSEIELPFGEPLQLGSKYKTLEYLIKTKVIFAELDGEEGELVTMACVFGHYQYKLQMDELKNLAAESNRDIENAYKGYKAAGWAKNNPKKPLVRARAKAWRDFLSFKECVICLDFPHAMTVHKSQGSTYDTVFLDMEDLYKAAYFDITTYLQLTYVGMSRASNMVITN